MIFKILAQSSRGAIFKYQIEITGRFERLITFYDIGMN